MCEESREEVDDYNQLVEDYNKQAGKYTRLKILVINTLLVLSGFIIGRL